MNSLKVASNKISLSTADGVFDVGTVIVDTVADLLKIDGVLSDKVYVLGYHTKGDGGGGLFYYDENELHTNHNGGTIISTAKTFPTVWPDSSWYSDSDVGAGCWKRVYDGAVNVKWFGAKGDGATDDTKAIQSAVNEKNQSIYIPVGNYIITAPIYINDTGFDNISQKIYGDNDNGFGLASVMSKTNLISKNSDYIFIIGPSDATLWSGITIKNLSLVDDSKTSIAGILVRRINLGNLVNLSFNGFENGAGIQTDGLSGNPQYWLVDKCNFYRCKYGINCLTTSADWIVSNCTYWGVNVGDSYIPDSIGLNLKGTFKVITSHIQYCDTAIRLEDAPVSKIIGCAIENSSGILGSYGINIVSGDRISIIDTDIVNSFTTYLNISAGVNNTKIMPYEAFGTGGTVIDNGTDTLFISNDVNFSSKINSNIEFNKKVNVINNQLDFGNGVSIFAGGTNPEGAVVANVGSIYLRTTGGAGYTLYVKEASDGLNTGWVAK